MAAKAITEIRSRDPKFVHLVHPRPVKWSVIVETISKYLKIPSVPYKEWLKTLEAFNSKLEDGTDSTALKSESHIMEVVPAVRILGFFRKLQPCESNSDVMGLPMLSTTAAQKHLPALSKVNLPQLSSEDVVRSLHYWQKIGFLP